MVLHNDLEKIDRKVLDEEAIRYRLAEEVARSLRYQRGLSLLLIELGPVTDAQLKRCSEKILRSVRFVDIVGQLSCHSLLLIMPETSDQAEIPTTRVMNAVLGITSEAKGGLVRCPNNGSNVKALLLNATEAAAIATPGRFTYPPDEMETFQLAHLDGIVICVDPAMKRLFATLRNLAKSNLSILVTGETGVGKEIVANAVHMWSNRSAHPFVAVNCAAIPSALLESELFGYERGAFSGADRAKAGLIETASNGTLFLDEISEASPDTQAKLLRVLETHRSRRVGSNTEYQVDVRLVAATNQKLAQLIQSKRFRKDLFYRLSAAKIAIPPLRERPLDIIPLAQAFLEAARQALGRSPLTFTPEVDHALESYLWPGNIRELKNLMAYLAATEEGPHIDIDALSLDNCEARNSFSDTPNSGELETAVHEPAAEEAPFVREQPRFKNLKEEIRALEKKRIEEALLASDGNRTQAAALIGMPLRTLVTKLKVYGLSSIESRRRDPSKKP